jgi:hypothetical protein
LLELEIVKSLVFLVAGAQKDRAGLPWGVVVQPFAELDEPTPEPLDPAEDIARFITFLTETITFLVVMDFSFLVVLSTTSVMILRELIKVQRLL